MTDEQETQGEERSTAAVAVQEAPRLPVVRRSLAERAQDQIVEWSTPAGSDIERWARDAFQIGQIAARLALTEFVPTSYRKSSKGEWFSTDVVAAHTMAAILAGREVGLAPMASLRTIDIIEGTPSMRALLLRGIVQAAGHEIWTVESTSTFAIVQGRRRGSERVETVRWDQARATSAGLLQKPNWRKDPTAMYLARATSALVRLIAADLLVGLGYSTEELQDGLEDIASPAVEEKPKRRTARRAPLPSAEVPDLDLPVEEPTAAPVAQAEAVDQPMAEEPPVEEEGARPFEDDPMALTAEERAELEQDGAADGPQTKGKR